MVSVLTDVACTGCGCVCDDLTVTVEDHRIHSVGTNCPLARAHFADAQASGAFPLDAAQHQAAIAQAAALLAGARSPLFVGGALSGTEGQRALVELADAIGAVIDPSPSLSATAAVVAFQQAGESTCTLGEVRHRSDFILYWRSNPVVTHPRHLERYSAEATTDSLFGGRAARTLIVVDEGPTETSAKADLLLAAAPDGDLSALTALRMLVRGLTLPADWQAPAGWTLVSLRDLAQRMLACHSGVIFYGEGVGASATGHASIEALSKLVMELNRTTRFYSRRMRQAGGAASNVLCWQTGFAQATSLASGGPRYGPGEYSASTVIERREADVCLVVGREAWQGLSAAARAELQAIPTILLDRSSAPLDWQPTVTIGAALRKAALDIDLVDM